MRANGAIQVVGKPGDTAPDGTIEIHLVHPIGFTTVAVPQFREGPVHHRLGIGISVGRAQR